jgi:hypothetical protein
MIFHVFPRTRRSLAQICKPQSLNSTILSHQHSAAALHGKTSIHSHGIQVDRSVSRCCGACGNRHSRDIRDDSLRDDRSVIVVEAKEDSVVALFDILGRELRRLHRRLYERRVVLDDGIILQRMHEDDFTVDNDGVCNGNCNVTHIVGNDCPRNYNQPLFGIDN